MLYTRKGDSGTSTLFNTKERRPKNDQRFEALGTLDETNSMLGWCRAGMSQFSSELAGQILKAQQSLFIIQAELAGAPKSITPQQLIELESDIDLLEKQLPPIRSFLIPGATELSARCDVARTVCRRAERVVIGLREEDSLHSESLAYINRLSSFLYALARFTAVKGGIQEIQPTY